MKFDGALVAGKLRRWEKYLNSYHLPRWEEIPDFGLYMEQVVTLLKEYMDYLPPELKEEQFITASTINNYVRMGLMPGPVKRRYYRIQLAYLIVICSLKTGLSLALIHKIMPANLSEVQAHKVYDAFLIQHASAGEYFIREIRGVAGKILEHEDAPEMAVDNPEDMIVKVAVAGSLCRLLAEKLLLLEGRTLEDRDDISINRIKTSQTGKVPSKNRTRSKQKKDNSEAER